MGRRHIAAFVLVVAACGGALSFCSNDSGNPTDGGADALGDGGVPSSGFALALTPQHINADPGDSNQIKIQVLRASGFTDDVFFTIAPVPGVSASTPGAALNPSKTSTLSVHDDDDAGLGDITLVVTGSNLTKTVTATATLAIHVGTIVQVGAGELVVPPYATVLDVSVWGAGGGGSAGCPGCGSGNTNTPGSLGGGGGFASDKIPVTPGDHLIAIVGTGGGGGHRACGMSGGGGGGGFSAVQLKGATTYLVIAGAGGGAGSASAASGGPGGGATGGGGDYCAGWGGTQTNGGASGDSGVPCPTYGTAGAQYQGGHAFIGACDAGFGAPGLPGGGAGGISSNPPGGGGGGGGYYGGGGGSGVYGGGGGSAFISVADAGGMQIGNGAFTDVNDSDWSAYCHDAGTGGTIGSSDGGPGGDGYPGCVVVRLVKP